jgi:hypothetical protein
VPWNRDNHVVYAIAIHKDFHKDGETLRGALLDAVEKIVTEFEAIPNRPQSDVD